MLSRQAFRSHDFASMCASPCRESTRSLLCDRRGLSTIEYAVLFILLLAAGLALWSTLGRSLYTQVDHGRQTFASALQAGNERGAATLSAVGAPSSRSGEVGPSSAGMVPQPTAAKTPNPAATNASTAATQTGSASQPTAPSSANGAGMAAATLAGSTPQPTAAKAPNAAATPQSWSERPIGTGGKVAVVAAGAVAGAAIAAGTSWGTAYAASALCGPAAPACAGAVTVGLLGVGVYALATGGFSQLTGAFRHTFSDEPASVGDALTVGTTLGGLLYGASEAAAVSRSAVAASSTETSTQIATAAGALERGSTPATPVATAEAEVFHATTSSNAAQGVLNGIEPKFLNPNTRFGRAFYTAENPETALAELAHHGATPTHGIRYSVDVSKVRVLDLTDPGVAAKFGYTGGPITPQTQAIGARALEQGYSAIRFPSLRGPGNNVAILKDFNTILKPQMLSPATP